MKNHDGHREVFGIRVGKAQTTPDAPSHTRGTAEGNHGKGPKPNATRSTGIRADAHEPIDATMPKISPA
ncbi:MAG TPA: hypothetical protein VGL61_36580 [Kofleriaceae bacterium]|jgi:hypothetical protein